MMRKLWAFIILAVLKTSCRAEIDSNGERTQQLGTVPISTEDCSCVDSYKCTKNGTYNTDGSKIIHYKMGIKPTTNKCPPTQKWCCSKSATSKPAEVTPTPKPTAITTDPSPTTPRTSKCGTSGTSGEKSRIFQYKVAQGRNADHGEFPWMVMVLQNEEVDGTLSKRYKCGGSLIHEKVVLTAAHCAIKINTENGIVRAGERDALDNNEKYSHQDRSISQIISHQGYDRETMENDISLLVASEPFKLDVNVGIVCLPKANDVITDSNCIASGWGKNELDIPLSTLKKVGLPMVPNAECLSRLKATRKLDDEFTLHESFICAGGIEGKDTCQGDGGSPLVCPIKGEKDRFQQIGIVAWGLGCQTSVPGVYVNVPLFKNWIDDQMRRLGFKTEYGY